MTAEEPSTTGTEIPPRLDDEMTVTVRLRLASPKIRDQVATTLIRGLAAEIVDRLDDDGFLALDGVTVAGVDISLPDFRPYQTGYAPVATRPATLPGVDADAEQATYQRGYTDGVKDGKARANLAGQILTAGNPQTDVVP